MSMEMAYIERYCKGRGQQLLTEQRVTWVRAQSNASAPTYWFSSGASWLPANRLDRAAIIRRVGLSGDRFSHAQWFGSRVVEPSD